MKKKELKDFEVVEHRGASDRLNLFSHRGHALVCSVVPYEVFRPTITVELRTKWYELFLITVEPKEFYPKGWDWLQVYSIHFGHLDDAVPTGMTPFVDHVPNIDAVRLFAARQDYEIDELAVDLITGRWHNEVADRRICCPNCNGVGGSCDKCRGHGLIDPRTHGYS